MPRNGRIPFVSGRAAGKVQQPTSYTATGSAQIPKPDLGNEAGSSQPVRIQELVPELASPYTRLLTYNKMMNDAGVDVSMRAAKTPVLGAEFYIDPYSESPQDELIAEFVWSNLTEGMAAPFLNSLEDILHMYEDGYSVLEKVYENRTWSPKTTGANAKTYTMLKKLGVRPASTIGEIDYDNNGGPKTLNQKAIQADKTVKDVALDVSKVLIFTFGRRGGDMTGKSLLRTAYPHWYYKTHFYKIDAIQKERHSLGVPKGILKPGYSPEDRNILRTMLRNLRSNEEAFILLTPNVDVEFAEVKGNLVNVLESATHHNIMILMNVMAQFLAMGVESGGARAASSTQTDVFLKALKYVAKQIVDVINMYLIPELVVWNFPTNNFPKVRVRNIGDTRDLQALASALSNLYAQGAVTPDMDTEQWIRQVFDMPAKQENAQPSAPVAPVDKTGAPQNGNIKPGAVKTDNIPKSATSAQ